MDIAERSLEARVDWNRYEVQRNGQKTVVQPFSISVDFDELSADAQKDEVTAEIERLKNRLGLNGDYIGLGMERFDYIKGIPDWFRAINRFLEKYPQYQKRMIFIQAGVPAVCILRLIKL